MPTIPAATQTDLIVESQLELIWSSTGEPDQFSAPDGIGLDQQGNLYVSDGGNSRIQKLDSQGKLITLWGSNGAEDGQLFCKLCGLAVDQQGNVFITDTDNSRVQKFDGNGKFLLKWGSPGSGDGEFNGPFGLAVDRQGNVYVGDVANGRIQKFDNNGKFLVVWGSRGPKEGQFSWDLADIAVDGVGDVYVTDRSKGLQKFDRNGNFLARWQICGDKKILGATGVAVDAQDNVYVFDLSNSRICKFDRDGKVLAIWGGLENPVGFIALDQEGHIYTAEVFNNQVNKYRLP